MQHSIHTHDTMAKRKRAALLPTNIALLQNLVRRDPPSYKEEFLLQYQHYESIRDIYMNSPQTENSEEFGDLVGFVAQVASCYPKETANFPDELSKLILDHHQHLDEDLREKLIQSIVLLKNKGVITPEKLISTLFPILLITGSKQLRTQIYSNIITIVKAANTGHKAQKLNKSVQALLFNVLSTGESSGLWATKLTRELWRRGIWDDSRTVEIMAQATLHGEAKIAISGVRFFLGADKEREEANAEDSDSDASAEIGALKHRMQINKTSKKRGRRTESAMNKLLKKRKGNNGVSATYLNFSAMHLMRDPQGFADQLFTNLCKFRYDLEQKILIMNLVSRMIGTHKLTVLGIYSHFLKYLTPKQKDVTQIMAAAAQASHDLVPPDAITPMIRKIADEFVSDGVSAEVCSAGINTIREILARNPLAIEAPLLQDLTAYKGSKAKAVVMAARSLVALYREVAPEMLARKDRGKEASMAMSADAKTGTSSRLQYGVEKGHTGIEGLELLAKWKADQNQEEDDEKAWEVDSDSDDDSDDSDSGWVNIEDDKDYHVSDSDDDDELDDEAKAAKAQAAVDAAAEAQNIMATKILTPADFAKLEELKAQAGLDKLMGKKLNNEDEVDARGLIGPVKYKQLRAERIAAAQEGREGREKFGSRKGKRDAPHSTTNREKARKKNFMMTIHKKDVQGKAKRSLIEKKRLLRAHIDKQKKKGF